ncbi:ThiF family protein [Candidatus Vecturithrix granuli]|uniref:ThiF family protein n=1 Tax=Vecturithrix granuli TaxID=1499967 RepID=A0A081C2K0_VECG1|nr:ThiF family protein [Candidatus Vecturithrix granuli]
MKDLDVLFSRHLAFWGEEKQRILAKSSVVIAGVGGLGCIVAQILVRAGIGTLILIDNKSIDRPDLNRQALFTLEDVGKSKIEVASQKLSVLTRFTRLIPLQLSITDAQFPETLHHYSFDGIADCLDNYPSRFALESALGEHQFLVHGGVQEDYGQLTTIVKQQTPLLKDIYYGMPQEEKMIPVCPQIVFCLGSLMAYEVQKNLWNEPELRNTLLVVELSDFSFSKIPLTPLTERKEQAFFTGKRRGDVA